jgi:hypothetical protein
MKKTVPFLLLVILFAAAAWYSFIKEPEAVHELPPPVPPVTMPVTEQQPQPVPQDEDIMAYIEPESEVIPDPLPPLNESDTQVTQAMAEIVGVDPLAEYLVKSQAISRIVVTVDRLTSRQIPAQINPVKPAADKFIVDTEGESVVLSAKNFARYDGHVALIQNADTEMLVVLYQRYSPLFQIAWEENGGEGSFNDRLLVVIDHLLETPDVPGPIYLSKPEAVYLFEEPELEAMTAGQKILVRMGSVNASVVKEKLLELKEGIKSQ